jgi:predicted RND superfamily exporter protein
MFLGAIILGNGINYPIVLLTRYREFRRDGMRPAIARREAVQNALRAEFVGACVASIAYGSLSITDFRGFNQFGWIGFVGMLLVWISMIPCLPALLVVSERTETLLPRWMQGRAPPGRRGAAVRALAVATERAPWVFIAGALAISAVALYKVPRFLRDP